MQAEETKHKLSERNCVEILQTLMKSGVLKGLMYTLDGKEYLTPEQLKRELLYELEVAGGRISLSAVETALNLDSSYIHSKAQELIKEDSSLQLIGNGNEMISDDYVTKLVEEIADQLLEGEGHITVGDLATKYALSVSFMSKALERKKKHISDKVHVKQGVLYTNGFVDRHKGRVLGALNAVTRPISIQKLVQLHGFIDNDMVEEVITEVISSGMLKGVLRRNEFTPDIFGRMQHVACESFFESNGYLPKERARKVRITDAAKFLKRKHPDVINLNSYVIDASIYDRLEAVVMEDVVAGKRWASISVVFEDIPFDEKDIEMLGTMCCTNVDGCVQIGADFIMSKAYINGCREIISSKAKASATIDAKANANASHESKAANMDMVAEADSDNRKKSGKKKNSKGKGGKRGRRNKNDSDDEDVQEVVDAPSKSSKRKGKGKRSKKGKRGGDSDDEYGAQSSNSRKKIPDSKRGDIGGQRKVWKASDINKILQENDEVLGNEDEENLLEALGLHLLDFGRSEYKEAYDVAVTQLSKSGAANTRDILNALEKQFHAQYASLQNNAKTCAEYRKLVDDILLQMAQDDSKDGEGEGEDLQGDASLDFAKRSKDVALHLSGLKEMCIESCSKQILAIVLGMELSKVGVDVLDGQDCTSQNPRDKAKDIIKLLSDLGLCRKYIDTSQLTISKGTMVQLFDATKNGPEDLLELLPSIANECDLLLKKIDKKEQKQMLFGKRKRLIQFFDSENSEEKYAKTQALSNTAKLVFLSQGILLPEVDLPTNSEMSVTPLSLLMTASVGKILTPVVHTWISSLISDERTSISEKEIQILKEIGVTKKLANIDEALFQS